ncbi:MAG TPA: hypothetical protein VJT31_10290, partial [Rugosimonospora sp.]|nr:hypothetical protein [Rugosimonospora sp.]
MPRPRVPLLFLLAAAALAGAVGTGSALDLFRRPVSIARNNALEDTPLTFYRFALGGGRVQPELTAPVYVAMPRLPEQRTLGLLSGGTGVRGTGWLIASALPGALLGLALLALLVWAF